MIYLGYGFLQSEKGSRYSSQNIDRYLPDMSIDTRLTCRPSDVGQYIKQISFCVLVNILTDTSTDVSTKGCTNYTRSKNFKLDTILICNIYARG